MYSKGPWEIKPEEVDKPYIRIRGTRLGGRFKIANVLTPVHEDVHPREADETRHNARLMLHRLKCSSYWSALMVIIICQSNIRNN